jgi:uncharacterized protein (DUF427 family)
VRTGLFELSDRRRSDPAMGEGTCWTVRVRERRAVDAACSSQRPPEPASAVAGLVAFAWDSVDGVFEEDEEVFVHPRDPCTRIDVLRSARHVRVSIDATVVAGSTRPQMLLENGLPVRDHLPREDVRTDPLEPSCTTTRCPYEGVAHHWSLRLGEQFEEDLVWTCPEPVRDAEAVGELLCITEERVDLQAWPDNRR